MIRVAAVALATSVTIVVAGCAPPPVVATRLGITTELTVCGGVIPPPGVPWCRTSNVSRSVEVRSGRDLVASGTSDAAGRWTVAVPPGRVTVASAAPEPYEECDTVTVTAVEATTVPVTQRCTIFAP